MVKLKAYEWEAVTFPEFNKVRITEDEARRIIVECSKRFEVPEPRVVGGAWWGSGKYSYLQQRVKLCFKQLYLDVVLHEFAHHLNWIRYHRAGHRGTFKTCLAAVYSFARLNAACVPKDRLRGDQHGQKAR